MNSLVVCAVLLSAGAVLAQRPLENSAIIRGEELVPPTDSHIAISDLPPYVQEILKTMKGLDPEVSSWQPDLEIPKMGGCSAGWPGVPGKNGMPGRNGMNGLQGMKGDKGDMGSQGPIGFKGEVGAAGMEGLVGAPGPAGPPGVTGVMGVPGNRGLPGMHGVPGEPGAPGFPGMSGRDGRDRHHLWKQCAWMGESDDDSGVIKSCNFTKMHNNTWLKVSFSGNLRVGGCTNCCARWFFAFDGVECSTPVPIDASIYVVGPHTANPLRPRHIEGYCGSIPKGPLSVDFSVGTCSGFSVANAYTGWNSASRVIIEEVEPPQQ